MTGKKARTRARNMMVAVAAATTGAVVAFPVQVDAAATSTLALWQMNQAPGASRMNDSTANNLDGTIGSAVVTGVVVSGTNKAYHWTNVKPNEPPAKPERLVTVADSALNPGTADYAVTLRFRTTHSFGNIIQKGQSGSKGGYFKFQNVRGKITCLFRGIAPDGTRLSKAVNSGDIPLNDGAWHTLRCERTSDRVVMTIDGLRTRRGIWPTGNITSSLPLSIGGKSNCDQVTITCDYFAGDIDYVRIEKN